MNIRSTSHVRAATEGERTAKLWLAWPFIVIVAVIVPQVVLNAGLASALGLEDGSFGAQVAEGLANLVTIAVVGLWVTGHEKRSFSSVGFRGDGIGWMLGGLVGGVIIFAIPMLILVGMGVYELGGSEHSTSGVSALPLVLALIPVWLIQGTAEETVFRGYLLQRQALSTGAWATVILIALGFGLIHGVTDPLPLANISLAGILFVFIVLARGSLWLAGGVHAGWNMAQGQIFGIPVSGIPREVSVLDYGPTADTTTTMSGGEFGLEGSIVATIWLAILCVVSYRYFIKSREGSGAAPRETPAEPAR